MARRPQALKDLEYLYLEYGKLNQVFWGGRLPKDIHIYVVPFPRCGVSIDTRTDDGSTTYVGGEATPIEINGICLLHRRTALAVLAHEMIHVSGVPNHGKAFRAEIDRLAKEGFLRRLL